MYLLSSLALSTASQHISPKKMRQYSARINRPLMEIKPHGEAKELNP